MFHRYKTPKYYLTLSADDLAMVKGILLWWRNKLIRDDRFNPCFSGIFLY